ncbi:MAG: hypothetical protein NWE94_02660 [Candidatus Bathyarchaeota archaeon]|nr:hypothetical protein [Candidatus Bathyarchaeota archaeon]
MKESYEAAPSWREWKLVDIIYGIVIPSIVALLIIGVSMVSTPSLIGLKYPLLEAVVIVGVPMLLGLIWNQWAGGAAGFLLGSFYALYYADQLYASQGHADISLIGNLVSAMLIGYIAGALNKRSDNYRRMLIAGGTSGIMGSLFVLLVGQFSPIVGEASVGGVVLVFLPRVLAGVIVPLIARAFLRHGALQNRRYMPSAAS